MPKILALRSIDRLRRLVGALLLLGAAAARAADPAPASAPEPIENFTRMPALADVVVSPTGRRMAVLVYGADGRSGVAVMNLTPPAPARLLRKFDGVDITDIAWVTDDRLIFDVREPAHLQREGMAGSFAIDADGGNERQLISWVGAMDSTGTLITSRVLPYGWFVAGVARDGSDDVFVTKTEYDARGEPIDHRLGRLNTRTGELKNLSHQLPARASHWWLNVRHEPVLLSSTGNGRTRLFWRAGTDAEWQQVAEFDDNHWPFVPLFLDRDGRIIVRAQVKNDVEQLHVFDPVKRKLDPEPVIGVKGFDMRAQPLRDGRTGQLLGVRFKAHAPMDYWFDDDLAALQSGIDAALPPDRHNRLHCGDCVNSPVVVVESTSDRQPGEFLLFDRSKRTLVHLGNARPWIAEARQGRRTLHRVAMRDGLVIPVYVTHPAGSKPEQPMPTVVLVHGGPWVRGADVDWEAEAQFLASRGYRVIEPEFRGSTGYGTALWRAGWKQWGRAMQDDLADALGWAVRQKLSDAGRACVMGGSYGGYAALMAPITHPGTFRCAISLAGVTDINLMFDITWSDFSDEYKRFGMPLLIGDPKADAAMLAVASPLQRAAEITVPVLLAHGGVDRRVPPDHARRFIAAAEAAKVPIEVKYYAEEGHGFNVPANRADYYRRVEAFLARSLAPRP